MWPIRSGYALCLICLSLLTSCADKRQLAVLRHDEGVAHLEEQALERAAAAFEEAAALDPANPDPLIGLGRACLAAGQYQQGAAVLSRAAGLAPGSPEVAGLRILCQLGEGGYLKAPIPPHAAASLVRARLEAGALMADPPNAQFMAELVQVGTGDPTDPAVATARWAVGHVLLGRALVLRQSGDVAGAIAAYRQAVATAPGIGQAGLQSSTSYGYTEAGRVSWRVDAQGDTTAYEYGPLGRLAQARYADGTVAQFVYDTQGRLLRLTSSSGTTRFAYDRTGHLSRAEYPDGTQVRVERQPDGTRSTAHLPGAGPVTYEYGEAGELVSATSDAGRIQWVYGAAGEVVEITRSNGVSTRYRYDADGRPVSTIHAREEVPFLEYHYTLNPVGLPIRRVRVLEGDSTVVEMSYDLAGRLVAETRRQGAQSGGATQRSEHAYDLSGNRLRTVSGGDTTAYLYGGQHRLQAAGDAWLDHDAAGRIVRQHGPDGARIYAYDPEGRLVSTAAPGSSARLSYRADGVLSGLTGPAGQALQVYGDPDGHPLAVGASGRIRPVVTDAAGSVLQWGDALYLRDAPQGNVVALSDTAGALSPVVGYTGFGLAAAHRPDLAQADSGITPVSSRGRAHGFRGGWRVGSTDLVLLDGRPYDPDLGRYLTPAWAEAAEVSAYRNPYQAPDHGLAGPRSEAAWSGVVRWVRDDPLATAVADALGGAYAPPIAIGPAASEAPDVAALLDDPRLPPSLSGAGKELFAEEIMRPEASRFSAALQGLPRPAAALGERASHIAIAHVARRWGRSAGQKSKALAGGAGITNTTGGLTRPASGEGGTSLDRLEGYESLFGTDYVSADSAWSGQYRRAVGAAATGRGSAAVLSALATAHPDGPWAIQLHLLQARELVRDEQPHRALEVLAWLGDRAAGTDWDDDILVARAAFTRRAGSVAEAETAVAEMSARHPDSPWLDDAQYLLALTIQEDGQLARAARMLSRLPGEMPQSVWTAEAALERPAYMYLRRLSRITGASFDAASRQLVLAGEWDPALPPLDMDDLAVALRAIYVKRQDPAVSIGTEPSGQPGYKKVRYDGGTGGTTFGQTMFAADYVLKTLSIGQDSTGTPLEPDLEGYRSAVDWTMELEGLSLGMTWNSQVWFVPEQVVVSRLEEGVGISISDVRMVVQSQSRFARRRIAHEGVEAFAQYLTAQYPLLESQYPSIARLSQLARLVAIAKWMRDDRIPVDLDWLEGYRLTAVDCPSLVKASTAAREARTGDSTWDSVRLEMEGGVSFREPNQYRPEDQRAARVVTEALARRPRGSERATWSYTPEGEAEREQRAVALPMGQTRRDGNLRLAHTDLSGLRGVTSAALVRYYDSFDAGSGPFGPGWRLAPYALHLTRDLSGSPGDRGEIVEGDVVSLEDRANGGSEPHVLVSEFTRGPGLRRVFGGGYSLVRASGAELVFDESGHLVRQLDGIGGQVDFAREDGTLTSIGDHLGRRIRLARDPAGRVVGASDNAGNEVQYAYDDEGRLARVRADGSAPLRYEYDVNGRLTRAHTGTPESFQLTYDAIGRMRLFQGGDGRTQVFGYDGAEYQSQSAGTAGSGTRAYDTEFRLVQSEGGVNYAYTAEGDVAQVSERGGGAVEFGYDHAGNLVEIRDPRGRSTYLRYDREGLRFLETAPGTGRALEYDEAGKLRRISDGASTRRGGAAPPGEGVTELEYDERGLVSAVSPGSGGKVAIERDEAGRVIEMSGPNGRAIIVGRDDRGRVSGLQDGAGRTVALERDGAGRLQRLRTATAEFQYEYDGGGRLKTLSGPGGARTEVEYRKGRPEAVEFADGARLEFTYDELGRLEGSADPAGVRVERVYDDQGRVVAVRRLAAEPE